VNPSFVLGAPLSDRIDSTSTKFFAGFLNGSQVEKGVSNMTFGIIDVTDLAEVHVRAAEMKEANGRYLTTATSEAISFLEICNILRESGEFNDYSIPTKETAPVEGRGRFDNSKVKKDLGMEFTSLQKTIIGMGKELIQMGIVKKN